MTADFRLSAILLTVRIAESLAFSISLRNLSRTAGNAASNLSPIAISASASPLIRPTMALRAASISPVTKLLNLSMTPCTILRAASKTP